MSIQQEMDKLWDLHIMEKYLAIKKEQSFDICNTGKLTHTCVYIHIFIHTHIHTHTQVSKDTEAYIYGITPLMWSSRTGIANNRVTEIRRWLPLIGKKKALQGDGNVLVCSGWQVRTPKIQHSRSMHLIVYKFYLKNLKISKKKTLKLLAFSCHLPRAFLPQWKEILAISPRFRSGFLPFNFSQV